MYPRAFHYHRASRSKKLAMLGHLGDEAKLLAGGQSLIPLMKLRFANPHISSTLILLGHLIHSAKKLGTSVSER